MHFEWVDKCRGFDAFDGKMLNFATQILSKSPVNFKCKKKKN